METSAPIGRRRRSAGLYVRAVLAVGHLCEVRYRHAHAGTCAPSLGRTSRRVAGSHPPPGHGVRYEEVRFVPLPARTPATAMRASAKCGGNVRPRAAARRRIPRQAVALKKYRCGTSPVSKMSDKEDATPALGYSKVLSVQDSVGP